MRFHQSAKRVLNFVTIMTVAGSLLAPSSFALRRSEANRLIPEGEYNARTGKKVRRAPASKVSKKQKVATKKKSDLRHPASESKRVGKRSVKKPNKRHHAKAVAHPKEKKSVHHARKARKQKFPVARETPHERDMPFVSIPARRVKRTDKMIVMDDPALKHPLPKPRLANKPSLKPDGDVLDPESDSAPSEVGAAKAAAEPPLPAVASKPVIQGPAPASVEAPQPPAASDEGINAANEASREPDAFDLHSGKDPMQSP